MCLCTWHGLTKAINHTSNNVEATSSNATSRTILSRKSNVASTLLPSLAAMLPFLATMSNEILFFWTKIRNKLNMFNLIRLCQKDEISRKTRLTLLPFLATKSNVASTKSNVASTFLIAAVVDRGVDPLPKLGVFKCVSLPDTTKPTS